MLKGIETQTMITRTTEVMRDADAQQRKNDLARDFQAAQTKTMADHEEKFVKNTERSQEALIQREKEEKGQQSRNQQEQDEPVIEETAAGAPVEVEATHMEMGNYLINIKI